VNEINAPGAGQDHALRAFNYVFSVKQAPYTPVYFDIEFDPAGAANRNAVETYFEDLLTGYQTYLEKQVTPIAYAIGVYGSGTLLRYCYEQGIASFFWQSNSTGYPGNKTIWLHANIVQINNNVSYPPCNFQVVDFDASWGDEGAW
jgi:hypothetical protein